MAIVTRRSARLQRHATSPALLRPGWHWGGTWTAPCVAPPPREPHKPLVHKPPVPAAAAPLQLTDSLRSNESSATQS